MHCERVDVRFGAWISKDFAGRRGPPRSGAVGIGVDDGKHVVIDLAEGSMKIAFEQVLRLVVHPSGRRACMLFEGCTLPKPLWSPEQTLVLDFASEPQPADWIALVSASLPVLRAEFQLGALPSLQFPSSFPSRFILEALQHACYHRLTQACVDRLAPMSVGALVVEAARLAQEVRSDPLTGLEPLEVWPRASAAGSPPGLHLVLQCEVHLYGMKPQLPRVVAGSRMLDLAAEEGLTDWLLIVSFTDVNGDRMTRQAEPAVREAMTDGLVVCGRRYRFLAASGDQLRQGGAWFLCEANPRGLGVDWLREQIGDLSSITNVSKYLARLGLSLSTSTWVADLAGCIEIEEDITIGGHCFTEGCGEMSEQVAKEIQQQLSLPELPSAVQIRLGGIKGMLVLSQSLLGRRVRVRKSMLKFESSDTGLRVVSVAAAGSVTLNHDVLTLLGPHVPKHTWHGLLQDALIELSKALYEADRELEEDGPLLKRFDVAVATIAGHGLRRLVGANPLNDPFMLSVLRGSYMAAVLDLCERMHVPVSGGVLLVGVADPSGALGAGEVYVSYGGKALQGSVTVYRNPACHPGDIRRLQAVGCPELGHLQDVIVFSVRPEHEGALPQFARCSGGDLDGDLYAVLFELEPTVHVPPDDGRPPTDPLSRPLLLQGLDLGELVEYGANGTASEAEGFLRVALNDALGQASNAHKALADRSGLGPYDANCIRLAALVGLAVDSPKTGDVVSLSRDLRSPEYPDWMLNPRKPTYPSSKILGELFRSVRDLHSIRLFWQKPSAEDYHSSSYVQLAADSALRDAVAEIFAAYRDRVNLALAGWQLKSEVEMLVGVVKRRLSRRHLQRDRDLVVRTRFILGQICEEFAERFEELRARPDAPSLEELAAAWWSADTDGCSAFRWIPWRRHGEALTRAMHEQPQARVHRSKSFPLLRLGEAVRARATGRTGGAVEQVLRDFLAAELAGLLAAAEGGRFDGDEQQAGQAAAVDTCIELLFGGLSSLGILGRMGCLREGAPNAVDDFAGREQQEMGREIVAAVSALPGCIAAAASSLVGALACCFEQREAERFIGLARRLFSCHAHRFCVCLDLDELFRPVFHHNHIVALTSKQLATISSKSFLRSLEEKSKARISAENHHGRKKDGRPAVWSLRVSGTFMQLLVVQQELERFERAPLASRAKFTHCVGCLELSHPVDADAVIQFKPQPDRWLVNPAHRRRGAVAYQFDVSPARGAWRGDKDLKQALQETSASVQPLQQVDISIS